jgi:hypothetical protein
MDLSKIVNDLVNKCIVEFKKDDNMERVKLNILDPCIKYLVDQFYPYIIATCVIFILTFILAIAIFVMILRERLFKLT